MGNYSKLIGSIVGAAAGDDRDLSVPCQQAVVMAWLSILQLLLQLAAQFARRAERADLEEAVLDALKISHGERVDRARDARDSVLSGRVQPDDNDPNRRD